MPRTRSRGSTTAVGSPSRPHPAGADRVEDGGADVAGRLRQLVVALALRRPGRNSSGVILRQRRRGDDAARDADARRPRRCRSSVGRQVVRAGSPGGASGRALSMRTRPRLVGRRLQTLGGEGREGVQRLAELVERQRLHVVLRGSACRGSGRCAAKAPSCDGAMVSGPRALEQRTPAAIAALPQQAAGSARSASCTPCDLVDAADLQVVLQVLADARQLVPHRDAVLLQQRRRGRCRRAAGAAASRSRRRRGSTSRARRARAARAALRGTSTPTQRALAVEHAAASTCAPVTTVEVGPLPRPGAGSALAVFQRTPRLLVDLEVAAALVVAAVEVVDLAGCRPRPPPRGRRRGSPSAARGCSTRHSPPAPCSRSVAALRSGPRCA